MSIPDTPTFFEWVALIQRNPMQARQLLISLQARIKKLGLMADPALPISVEDYDRAQHLLDRATTDPDRVDRIAHITRLGQATLGPYPDREDWLAMIKDDPNFAREACIAWETKRALLGLQTPQALQTSIEIYHSISTERPE